MPPLCCLNPGLSRLVKMSCCPVICKETGRVIRIGRQLRIPKDALVEYLSGGNR